MNEFVELISNVGFPIAACVFMFIQTNKNTAAVQEISRTMIEIQKTLEEMRRNEK